MLGPEGGFHLTNVVLHIGNANLVASFFLDGDPRRVSEFLGCILSSWSDGASCGAATFRQTTLVRVTSQGWNEPVSVPTLSSVRLRLLRLGALDGHGAR